MKVLYIGVYRDETGWSHSAIDTILALDAAGVDVVCRPLKLNDRNGEVPMRVAELEKNRIDDCTHVIQNVLPHHMDYYGEFEKNIGIYLTETDHFRNTTWAQHLTLMDEAWVTNRQMITAAENSHVATPLAVVPVPCDTAKYSKEYDIIELPGGDNLFRFYFLGEFSRRKNVMALLKAFHLEFRPTDKVQLVIKANIPGRTTTQAERIIRETCGKVKNALKIYRNPGMYHDEVVLTQRFTEEQIMRLHHTCDCFVMPSHGEAWCIPAFDAMAMGKTPICTNIGGPTDFLYKAEYSLLPKYWPEGPLKNYLIPPMADRTEFEYQNLAGHFEVHKGGWLVDGQPEPCYEVRDTLDDLYVSNENWQAINIKALRAAMREAYEDAEERKKRAANGVARAYDFSHLNVGIQMKELLDGTRQAVLHDWASKVREKHLL